MKRGIFFAFALAFAITACDKTGGFDSNKVIDGIRSSIGGKWKAEYMIDRYSLDTTDFPAGHVLEFKIGSADSAYYFINDSLVQQGKITWQTNTEYIRGSVFAQMSSEILPPVIVEGIYNDSLYMFTPSANGTSYILSKD